MKRLQHLQQIKHLKIFVFFGLVLFLFFISANTAGAAAKTWTGGGSTNNWSEGANWGGSVPATTDIKPHPSTCQVDGVNNKFRAPFLELGY